MELVLVFVAVALAANVAIVLILLRSIAIAAPNELLIVSGRSHRTPDGSVVGYRLSRGRVVRIPFLERVDRLSLASVAVTVDLRNASFRDGRVTPVLLGANVRVGVSEDLVRAAVERFAGLGSRHIVEASQQVLEGAVRQVAVSFSPEAVARDRGEFEQAVEAEAEGDLARFGLALESVTVQRIGSEMASYRT